MTRSWQNCLSLTEKLKCIIQQWRYSWLHAWNIMQKKETSCRLICNSSDTEEHRWKLWVCRNLFTFIFYLIFLSSRKQYVDKTSVCKSLKLATCFLYDNSPTHVCEQDISPIRLTFAPQCLRVLTLHFVSPLLPLFLGYPSL